LKKTETENCSNIIIVIVLLIHCIRI